MIMIVKFLDIMFHKKLNLQRFTLWEAKISILDNRKTSGGKNLEFCIIFKLKAIKNQSLAFYTINQDYKNGIIEILKINHKIY